ncbi:MAG: DUF4142 domain-containing protein [Acidobacteriaceae bacterium]
MKFAGIERAVILSGIALCGAVAALAQSDASKTDKYFVAAILETSNAEIQAGNLAQQKSSSPDVKRFAQRMIGDHTQLSQQMLPLAHAMTITVEPNAMTLHQQKTSAKLQELTGDAFDKDYISGQLDEQSHALRLFQSEVATTHDEGLKRTAAAGAKVTMVHIHMAEQLAAAHHVGTSPDVRRPGRTPGPGTGPGTGPVRTSAAVTAPGPVPTRQ